MLQQRWNLIGGVNAASEPGIWLCSAEVWRYSQYGELPKGAEKKDWRLRREGTENRHDAGGVVGPRRQKTP
jgi:hypothetical protein